MVSSDTPLISNLNIYENISLIKEVHELLSIQEAQKIADEYLSLIDLSSIGLKRKSQCSSVEIFYTMVIRALMSSEKTIIIRSPLSLIKNIREFAIILKNIDLLNSADKDIIILDTIVNETHYKGDLCLIIK